MKRKIAVVREQELCVECKNPIPTYRTYFCEECYAHMLGLWKGGKDHEQVRPLSTSTLREGTDFVAKRTYPFDSKK